MASTGSSVNRDAIVHLKQLRDKLGHFTKRIDTLPYEILLSEAPRIQQEAVMQVPVDSGDLRDSIKVTVTRPAKTRASLSASASSVHHGYDYAQIQHDNVWYHHTQGGPFYISQPFERGAERITDRLHDEVKYDR